VWWIRQSIMQSLAEQSRIVRLPMNRVSGLNRILKSFSVLEQKFQREPSTEELATFIGVSEEEVLQNQSHSGRHLSVDAPFQDGEDNSLLDVLSDANNEMPDADLITDSLKSEIQRAFSKLTSREAEVMKYYFGLEGNAPMNLEELGERLNLTRERVRQIKEKATRRLRQSTRNTVLKSYLG
jgi:RNA polymerase primary sigma factor